MKNIYLLLLFFLISITSYAQKTYLYCGKLIDGKSNELKSNVTVIIQSNKIADIQEGIVAADSNDIVINLIDKTVLPGLMDMHVHLEGETNPKAYLEKFTLNDADKAFRATKFAEKTLMAGFTTVRDLGGSGVNIALRKAIEQGWVIGPRIFTAGKSIAITGGHADPTNGYRKDLMGDPGPDQGVINGPDDCRKAVRQQVKNGADLIKITATGGVLSMARDGSAPQFTQEEIEAIVKTAKDFGIHTAAHAHGAEGMKRAIKAGITSIEHGTYMDKEVMKLMKRHNTYYVPTITAGKSVEELAQIPGYYPDVIVPKALAIGPQIQETFAKAYKAGVKIAFGSDAGVFKHGLNAKEFGYMVQAGMPPMEAIKAATITPAQMLKIDENVGTIEKGKLADIIAVNENPLENIYTLEHVIFVMKEGKIYKNLDE